MKITVYTPTVLRIRESDVPGLTAAARKRYQIPAGKNVSLRYIIEEARRAGLINLGRDYCIDLEETPKRRSNGTRSRNQKTSRRQ